MNRRSFLASLVVVPVGVAGMFRPRSSVAAPLSVEPAFHAFPRHARGIITDTTVRQYGPIMFIGDSTSAKRWDYVRREFSAAGIGPYRVDINLARSISRERTWRPSAVAAVREARAAGFDPPSFVIALGFPDILSRSNRSALASDPVGKTLSLLEPLMDEIGSDRTVGFLNLYGTLGRPAWCARKFNEGLAAAAERWPNLVVLDWASLAKRNQWWHKSDGFHYGYRGSIQRQKFIVVSLRTVAEIHAATSGPDVTDPAPGGV